MLRVSVCQLNLSNQTHHIPLISNQTHVMLSLSNPLHPIPAPLSTTSYQNYSCNHLWFQISSHKYTIMCKYTYHLTSNPFHSIHLIKNSTQPTVPFQPNFPSNPTNQRTHSNHPTQPFNSSQSTKSKTPVYIHLSVYVYVLPFNQVSS